MKWFALFLSLAVAQTAFAQDLRIYCKKIDAGSRDAHPTIMNVYSNSDNLKYVQLKYDSPNNPYSQVDLLGTMKTDQKTVISYSYFATYDPITKEITGKPSSDILAIETTLLAGGFPIEGVNPSSPRGIIVWSSLQGQTYYSCAISMRK